MSIIIGSFNRDKIIELCSLVSHKMCYAHSIGIYDVENKGMFGVNRGPNELAYNKIYITPTEYCIVHLQSTPCGRNIQPASTFDRDSEHYLWFNGELTSEEVERFQIEEDTEEKWQTMLLLKHIVRYGAPSDVDGSFSCVYTDGADLYLFRNELESMFIDDDMTICSIPFRASRATNSNRMFKMDLKEKLLVGIEIFNTVKKWV